MYGQLPSYVKANATTYDIRVTQTLLAWEKEEFDKAQGKPTAPSLTQEQMMKMIERTRNRSDK